MRAATTAAEPEEEPPGVCATFHGLPVGLGSMRAKVVVVTLPRITAPAARSRATEAASVPGRRWAKAAAPARVGIPATSKMSLSATGTPWSGP